MEYIPAVVALILCIGVFFYQKNYYENLYEPKLKQSEDKGNGIKKELQSQLDEASEDNIKLQKLLFIQDFGFALFYSKVYTDLEKCFDLCLNIYDKILEKSPTILNSVFDLIVKGYQHQSEYSTSDFPDIKINLPTFKKTIDWQVDENSDNLKPIKVLKFRLLSIDDYYTLLIDIYKAC